MNILFSTIDNGARSGAPYVHCTIEGLTVRWIVRPFYTGWDCQEHGESLCEHALYAETFLPRKIKDRMRAARRAATEEKARRLVENGRA